MQRIKQEKDSQVFYLATQYLTQIPKAKIRLLLDQTLTLRISLCEPFVSLNI